MYVYGYGKGNKKLSRDLTKFNIGRCQPLTNGETNLSKFKNSVRVVIDVVYNVLRIHNIYQC